MQAIRQLLPYTARKKWTFPVTLLQSASLRIMPMKFAPQGLGFPHLYRCGYLTVNGIYSHFPKQRIYPIIQKGSFPRLSSSVTPDNSDSSNTPFLDTTGFDESNSIPKPALYLGFAGALPFIGLSIASGIHLPFPLAIAKAQASYAACILTFLGAVHWGKALEQEKPDWKKLAYSVAPSIYAWSTFALPAQMSLYFLSGGLLAAFVFDVREQTFPKWYRTLRMPLSLIAVSCVLLTAYNTPLFP